MIYPNHERPRSPEPVRHTALFRRICVRPPYFALQNLELSGGCLSAIGSVELPLGGERSPMSAAEVGRHAAIVGLCCAALAQRDDARRYYLAQRADYQGFVPADPQGVVRFKGDVQRLDKRAAVVKVGAEVGGAPLAEVEVAYTVLTAPAFERLFRDRAQPTSTVPTPGDAGYDGELTGVLERTPDTLRLRVAAIPLEVCAGHFDGFPAMPVAVLMSQLSRLAGGLMNGPYHVTAGLIEADDLLWAGSEAIFEAKRVFERGREHRFRCLTYSGGYIKGKMELTFMTAA